MEFFILCIKHMAGLTEEMLSCWEMLDVYGNYANGRDPSAFSHTPFHVGVLAPS